MMKDDRPGIFWDGGWSLAALTAVLAPTLVTPLIDTGARHLSVLAAVSSVVVWTGVLVATLLFYLHWWMTGGPANWLVLAMTILAVDSLAQAGFVAADPDRSETRPGWMLLVQILVAAGLFSIVWLASRRELSVDPLVTGTLLALCVILLRYALVTFTDPLHLGDGVLTLLSGVDLLVDLAVAAAIFRFQVASRWVRARLCGALMLLSIGHAASYPTLDGHAWAVLAIAVNLLGAAGLLSLGVTLVLLSWRDNHDALELLSTRLEEAEAGVRMEQARLHEIRATAAGVSSASRLLHRGSALSETRRQQLGTMIDLEMDRLQRLLNHETPGGPAPIDLDATIQPVVAMHRARGYPVQWSPTGLQATARADDVAEVVNVLLENAVRHAPHAGASIASTQVGDIVEIAVSDNGPGVDQSVLTKLFEWGERGPRSPGSGIGLNVARELSISLGGYLNHVNSSGPGATFVLGLPAQEKL